MPVQTGLCWIWLETPKTGFVLRRLLWLWYTYCVVVALLLWFSISPFISCLYTLVCLCCNNFLAALKNNTQKIVMSNRFEIGIDYRFTIGKTKPTTGGSYPLHYPLIAYSPNHISRSDTTNYSFQRKKEASSGSWKL